MYLWMVEDDLLKAAFLIATCIFPIIFLVLLTDRASYATDLTKDVCPC